MQHTIGVFGMTGSITPVAIRQWKVLGYRGVKLAAKWSMLQPTETDLSFSAFYDWLTLLINDELDVNIQVWVGNHAPIGGTETVQGKPVKQPDWLARKGVNTFHTTGHKLTGPYPNYYEEAYKEAFNTLHRAFANFLNGLPANYKARIKSVFVSNGATGDSGPYKGTAPVGWEHIQNDETWNNYYKVQWAFAAEQYAKNSEFMTLAFNPGNTAESLTYCIENFPGSYLKHGDSTHEFPIEGEIYKRNWPETQWFGEIDDSIKFSPYPCVQFQCIRSALHVNTTRLDFMQEWMTNRYTPLFLEFVHKYVEEIYSDSPTKGFCALAEKVDFTNIEDYPVDMYGPLWDDQKLYDNSIRNADRITDQFIREMRYVSIAIGRSNEGRINKLREAGYFRYPKNVDVSKEGDYYNQDVSFYVTNNYFLHVTQFLPFQTSTGLFRIDEGNIYGRNARQFKLYNGKNAMYFLVNQAMKITNNADKVRISVTYKDIGASIWEIRCAFAQKCRVTNTNTNEWKKVFFDVENFKWGGKMENGSDFIVTLVRGTLFPIDMVEIENLDKIPAEPKEFDIFKEAGYVIGEIELDPEDAEEPDEIIGAEEARADDEPADPEVLAE